MSIDKFYNRCIYCDIGLGDKCSGRVEWEHAFVYKGRQINEKWAIVPVCTFHHRGAGLDKEYNQYRAIMRADIEDLQKRLYKRNWLQIKKYLIKKYDRTRT